MESKVKPENFSRLQQEHARAINGSREAIKKWEQFKYDYEVLQARLHTLPDQLTHDIMVPFGRFGFMRGHLYHTNEIMVLLGDNWFARRTAKQAIEIAGRRNKYVCEMLEKERKVMEDLQARTDFVSEISATASQVGREGLEIREDYDPEEEARRKEAKRREREKRGIFVPPPRPAFPRSTGASSPGEGRKREEGEGGRREEGERGRREEGEGGKREEGEGRKRVEGEGEKREDELWAALEKREAEEEEEEKEKENGSENGGIPHKPVATITFRHTARSDTTPPPASGDGGVEYSTPADIARLHRGNVTPPAEVGKGGGGKRGVKWNPHLVSCQEPEDKSDVQPPSQHSPFSQPPSQGTPFSQPPSQVTPFSQPPSQGTPFSQPPSQGTPFSQPPSQGTPFSQQPSQGTPFSQPPSQGTPFSQPPSQGTPFSQPPSQGTPFSQQPSQGTPFSQPPLQGTPFSQPPSQGTPFSQPPSQATPFSQPPLQGTPFSQPPSQGTPFSQPPSQATPFSQPPLQGTPFSQPPSQGTPFSQPPSQGTPFSQVVREKQDPLPTTQQELQVTSRKVSKFKLSRGTNSTST